MKLSHRAEEILETLWVQLEETGGSSTEVGIGRGDEAVRELMEVKLVEPEDGRIRLTEKGRKEARQCIRRHRLAERLMVDVLDLKEDDFCEAGCRFEHLLKEDVEESVCTLLGHPSICPHGKAIPPGECCKESRAIARKLVSPLSSMVAGEEGRVAYLNAPDPAQLHKLMAMGVLPGISLRMVQTFPSFVFEVGQTQYAVDRDLADCIAVRLNQNGAAKGKGRRMRWGRLAFGKGR